VPQTRALAAAQRNRQSRGVIEGRVTGPNGSPLQNVRVELLSDTYSPLASEYTDGSGRFRFQVTASVYYVDVEAQGQPYKRQRQRVEVNPLSQREVFYVQIQLVPMDDQPERVVGNPGVRFYQKVPDEARAEYERAMKVLKQDHEAGQAGLRKALQIFPDYYDAMEALGGEYVKADYLDYAQPILARAIEVNPSGEMSHYALGVLYFKKNSFGQAADEFSRVLELNPDSVNAMLYLGLARTREGKLDEAEPMLRKAQEKGAKNVPDLHLALASIYSKTNRPAEAAASLERLLKEEPDRPDREKLQGIIKNLREKAKAGGKSATVRNP
jgi:tetratricopeptide (TPR) repeat protein